MADANNAEPGARADVVPTIELLFRLAMDGRAGPQSEQIVKDPTFAFGVWIARWTALREEIRGAAPAGKPPPHTGDWKAREREAEQRKGTERAQARLAIKAITEEFEAVGAVGASGKALR